MMYLVLVLLLFFGDNLYAGVPEVLNYSGIVTDGGKPVNGPAYFKFALIDPGGDVQLWSNDSTGDCSATNGCEPDASVQIDVSDGRFSLMLGDTTMANMTAIDSTVFEAYDSVFLRVWYSSANEPGSFAELTPDRRLATTPYSFRAASADRLTGSIGGAQIEDGAVSTGIIATGAVTTVKIADLSVTSAKIADSSILSSHIVNNTIAAADISTGAITNSHISPDAAISISKINTAGLNADTLDNRESAEFLLKTGGTMTGGLTVTSLGATAVTAGSYAYSTPKNGFLSIPANAFTPLAESAAVNPKKVRCQGLVAGNKAVSSSENSTVFFYAGVPFSDTVSIIRFEFDYWHTANPGAATVARLIRNSLRTGSFDSIATVTTPSSFSSGTYETGSATISPADTVSNENYSYMVEIELPNSNFCINGVRIDFTIPAP